MTVSAMATAAYIVAALLFILSLAGLSRHESARQGWVYGVTGMGVALVATIIHVVEDGHDHAGGGSTPGIALMFVAVVVGGAIGLWRARIVRMTGMPELIALLHSFVGLAAVLIGWVGHREGLLARTPAASLRLPMSLASKMSALANDPGAMKVFLKDRTSAGNWASIRFLDRYMNYVPAVEPEDFDACPVLLTQPAEDRWTPHHLSVPVLSRITEVPVDTVLLDNAGHYPLEEPGLRQMQDAIADFVTKCTA